MKLAAIKASGPKDVFSPLKRRKSNPFFESKDWESAYEGLPNTVIKKVEIQEYGATVTLQSHNGSSFERKVAGLEYVVGRRGSLEYLDESLQTEVLGHNGGNAGDAASVSGLTLRAKVEDDLEVAPHVFVTGSLTGDSLVRFAFGGCVFAAREIMRRGAGQSTPSPRIMDGSLILDMGPSKKMDGYNSKTIKGGEKSYLQSNGHMDLGVNRKDMALLRDGASLIDGKLA